MKTRPHPPVRGYTLIEVMVAVALLGMVVTAVYSSWMAVVPMPPAPRCRRRARR